MKIIVASEAGFCFGIKRALKLIDKLIAEGKKVQTIGPLIHNPGFLKRLEARGISLASDKPDSLPNEVLVIRTHGISKEIEADMGRRGVEFIDATCPLVKKNQRIIARESQKRDLVFLGDERHPEVIAARSYGSRIVICRTLEELRALPLSREYAVIAQTTLDFDFFKEALAILSRKTEKMIVYNTICRASLDRQEEAREIAGRVDLVVVIGGKNSSNTSKLVLISKKFCRHVIHVDSLQNLSEELAAVSRNSFGSVGILAGASTPQDDVEGAISIIKSFFHEQGEAL